MKKIKLFEKKSIANLSQITGGGNTPCIVIECIAGPPGAVIAD